MPLAASKEIESRRKVELGNQFWELSLTMPEADRKPYLQRAKFWYLRAMAQEQDEQKTELSKQLRPRIAAVPATTDGLRILARGVDGSHNLSVSNTEIHSTFNTFGWPKGIINGINWDPQSGQIIKNVGLTRYLPEVVDFSTAKFINRQIGSQGELSFVEVAEDHVIIKMRHSPAGKCDFIYTVAFEK